MMRGGLRLRRAGFASADILFFFFNDTATTEIYTLSLHDALPISAPFAEGLGREAGLEDPVQVLGADARSQDLEDRKSTRLNSSHSQISYAVFCLKKNTTTSPSYVYSLADTASSNTATVPLSRHLP